MFKRRFRLPSPALVISMVTLSLVLGGTAFAASTATHKDKKADTKLIKKLAPTLSVKHAKTADNATHATSARQRHERDERDQRHERDAARRSAHQRDQRHQRHQRHQCDDGHAPPCRAGTLRAGNGIRDVWLVARPRRRWLLGRRLSPSRFRWLRPRRMYESRSSAGDWTATATAQRQSDGGRRIPLRLRGELERRASFTCS